MNPLVNLVFGGVMKGVENYTNYRSAKQEAKHERKMIHLTAQVAAAKAEAEATGNYDVQALKQMQHSWKDEYLTLTMTFPIHLSFLAGILDGRQEGTSWVGSIEKAWEAVALMPQWYQWSVLGIISATFGLRWMSKKNNQPIVIQEPNNGGRQEERSEA